jgi:hypothetical protein
LFKIGNASLAESGLLGKLWLSEARGGPQFPQFCRK